MDMLVGGEPGEKRFPDLRGQGEMHNLLEDHGATMTRWVNRECVPRPSVRSAHCCLPMTHVPSLARMAGKEESLEGMTC